MSLTQTLPTFTFNHNNASSFAKFTSYEDPRWNSIYSNKNSRKVSAESCDTASTVGSVTDASFKDFSSPNSGSPRDLRASFDSIEDENALILNSAIKPKKKVATDDTKYKTELCRKYVETGICPYGKKCKFAHGKHELNEKAIANKRRYKAKKCNTFHSTMCCPYGSRCMFAHENRTVEELQTTTNAYEKFMLFPELLTSSFANKKARLPSFMSAIDTAPKTTTTTRRVVGATQEADEEFGYIFQITSQ